MKASLGGLGVSKTTDCMLTIHQNKCLLFFISRQENSLEEGSQPSRLSVWSSWHAAAETLQVHHVHTSRVTISCSQTEGLTRVSHPHAGHQSSVPPLKKKSQKHILLRPPLHISVASTRRARRHLRCDQRTPCPSCTNRLVPLEPLLVSRS